QRKTSNPSRSRSSVGSTRPMGLGGDGLRTSNAEKKDIAGTGRHDSDRNQRCPHLHPSPSRQGVRIASDCRGRSPKRSRLAKGRPKQSPLGCALSTNSKNESRWVQERGRQQFWACRCSRRTSSRSAASRLRCWRTSRPKRVIAIENTRLLNELRESLQHDMSS